MPAWAAWAARAALGIAMLSLVAACQSFPSFDQAGGQSIADQIAASHSPIVGSLVLHPGDYLDGASVQITLRPGVADADAVALMCDLIEPAIRNGNPPTGFTVDIWDDTSSRIVVTEDRPCPAEPTTPG